MAPALPAGRGSLPPEATRFLQRARLLDATAQTIAESGYAAASIDAIRSRAGVSARTFYEHFSGKEDAVAWAFDAAASYTVPRVLEAFARQDEWAAGVDAALSTYLAIMDCDRVWAVLCLVELPVAVSGRRRALLAPLIEAFEPSSPAATPVPAEGMIAAIDGVVRDHLVSGGADLQALRGGLLALTLSPVMGPAGAGQWIERTPAGGVELDALERAHRVPRLVEGLPASAAELEAELRAACDAGDGPALWRAVLAFHDLRGRGLSFDWRLEQLALGGFEHASFFGMPVRTMGDEAASEWLVPSPAQRCLRFVAEHPGCSGEDVRQALGITHLSQVSRLLTSSRADGLVTSRRRRGRANAWVITDTGRAALGMSKGDRYVS